MTGLATRQARIRGFTLVEVLLSIFILGIGVIAVAALFPAGIAQQRHSVDDIIGPIVANNAMAILRTKLQQEDFGSFEDFNFPLGTVRTTINGDWPWMRPGIVLNDDSSTAGVDERGWVDVFTATRGSVLGTTSELPTGNSLAGLYGIPHKNGPFGTPPEIMITQGERSYPLGSQRPQYVWDCMFRRFEGRIHVAIFVYRVGKPGGGSVSYHVQDDQNNPGLGRPPLPVRLQIVGTNQNSPWTAAWDTFGVDPDPLSRGDDSFIPVPGPAGNYNPGDARQSWQEPRQWLLDQNNNIHRVLSRFVDGGSARVELTRPIPTVDVLDNKLFIYDRLPALGDGWDRFENVVTDVWYIPTEVLSPDGPLLLTPVYLTVREL